MQAYEIEITIPENHQVVLPPDAPTGRARMILLVAEPTLTPANAYSEWSSFIAELEASHARRTLLSADEIDRRIEETRADWD